MVWALILLVLVILTGFGILGIGFFIARSMYAPKCLTMAESRNKEMERTPDLLAAYDSWEKDEYWVDSPFGYRLKTYHVGPEKVLPTAGRRFCVIAHGYTHTHLGAVKYAWMMRKHGFDVVMYDERHHGLSGGKTCSLGYYESMDLLEVIDDTFRRYGDNLFLGTYGESMGASAVLLAQADEPRIKFTVADCPFSDLSDLVSWLIKDLHHLSRIPFLPAADLFFRIKNRVSLRAIRPIEAVGWAKSPILFIHGMDDRFIPPEHSRLLFEACHGPKEIWIAPNGARHAESFRKNPEEYSRVLDRFLQEKVFVDSR